MLNENLSAATTLSTSICKIELKFDDVIYMYSHEARKYAAKLKDKNIVAEAIVMTNLAIRLLANFYMRVNRPKQKIKFFSNEKAALEWINSVKGKVK